MQQFKRSFCQLLFFLTLALSLITFAFVKRPKFQSSLVVTTARVWGYDASLPNVDLNAFKNDVAVKGVFGILNKLFSDKKSVVSLFIHQFLLNKANLAKPRFRRTFSFTDKSGRSFTRNFSISNKARTWGLWSREGERALMDPDFKLSSLTPAQKDQGWLEWLRYSVRFTAIFDSDYDKGEQGAFNLAKTTTNIRDLFVGFAVKEMKVQLKDDEVLFAKNLGVLWEEMKVKLKGVQGIQGDKGEQGNKGDQGNEGERGTQGNKGDQGNEGLRGTQGDQGLRGPGGQIKKEVIIGLSIGLGVFFCFFLACVMVIYSTFKNPKKSTKI